MRNSLLLMGEALLTISRAGGGQLVKMLITLEPHGIFWITFCILIHINIVQPLVCKLVTRFAEHKSGWSRSFGESTHNS